MGKYPCCYLPLEQAAQCSSWRSSSVANWQVWFRASAQVPRFEAHVWELLFFFFFLYHLWYLMMQGTASQRVSLSTLMNLSFSLPVSVALPRLSKVYFLNYAGTFILNQTIGNMPYDFWRKPSQLCVWVWYSDRFHTNMFKYQLISVGIKKASKLSKLVCIIKRKSSGLRM